MRAVIYARFSSDLQDVRSITDQVSLARRYADTRGLTFVGMYEDAAISGASLINRPGLQRLLADASAQKFDVLITESLDRLSRSQADIAALYERLSFMGVRIETLADGHVSEIHVGLKGTMSALFLKDLAQKTRRGQMGRVKAGRIPGGCSYGYDVVPSGDDRGRRLINTQQAEVVRRIFAEYVSGKGTLAIVKDLNREGVPGPTGRSWNLSAVVGSPKRRNGLLNNELYRGVIVYNRQRFLKDPSTGKRVSRPNPESEWQRQDVPELRIVDEAIWQQAQRLRQSRGGPQIHKQRGPQRLFSGLVFCGWCGAKYNIATRDFMRCSARTNSGTCSQSRMVRMSEIEQRVLCALNQVVFTDEMYEAAVEAYRHEFVRAQGNSGAKRSRLEAELSDAEKKFARLLRLVEDGHADPAVAGPRLNELAAKKRDVGHELSLRLDDAPMILPGDGAARYRDLVEQLRLGGMTNEEEGREATMIVRETVQRIILLPRGADEPQAIEVEAGKFPVGAPTAAAAASYCNYGCGGWI
jgi:site-specific DNA recombinase